MTGESKVRASREPPGTQMGEGRTGGSGRPLSAVQGSPRALCVLT